MSKDTILAQLKNRRILLLGFGREGKSTYQFINEHYPDADLTIADANPDVDTSIIKNKAHRVITGNNYLDIIPHYDIVIKTPGISLKHHSHLTKKTIISSQTDLFLHAYADHCIGITGTKGKSTTTSLIYHILQSLGQPSLIAGNIGIPLFDIIPKIGKEDKIIIELSSHQLEFIRKGPAIAVLLNIFEEHLDHYNSFYDYQSAKFNIAIKQNENNCFIYPVSDPLINQLISEKQPVSQSKGVSLHPHKQALCYVNDHHFVLRLSEKEEILFAITDKIPLKGKHNLQNVCAALLAVVLSQKTINSSALEKAVYSFKSLAHRMEYVATVNQIDFYNDSISTIPQSTIAALEAIENVNTLILGGMDRGIDYTPLIKIFTDSAVEHFIFTGKAGERMMQLCKAMGNKQYYFSNNYEEIVAIAKKVTRKNHACLLSPAASSYDVFKNFEERGNLFKELIQKT